MMELTSTAPSKMMNAVDKLKSRVSNKTSKSPALLSRDSTGTMSGDNLSSHEPVQVEPKTYFANERTFIQWISAALLLLTVSSIMMGSGSYNGTSSVIAFSSLVLVCYASFVYFRRVKLLRSGNAYGYLDFLGPSILAAGVGVGVFIVFADAVKGSEFLPWGNHDQDDDRRFLRQSVTMMMQPEMVVPPSTTNKSVWQLQEVEGTCARQAMTGINMLEYQPRDIVLMGHDELMVATPQALVSHPLAKKHQDSAVVSEFPDVELQAMARVGDRLFGLSVGPAKTELMEFHTHEEPTRFLIHESISTTGSMVFVPASSEDGEGKLYIHIDGTLHSYQVPTTKSTSSSSSLHRTGSINMKVLNRGHADEEDPIVAMEYFDGLVYLLRQNQPVLEAWDFHTAALVAELTLPSSGYSNHHKGDDQWTGMTFQPSSSGDDSSVYLHMPLDTFPPQLWSFRLEQETLDGHRTWSFPGGCEGAARN